MDDSVKSFPSSLTLRIDWSEMDEFRHVNNVMFMKYIQAGRLNYWELTGIYKSFLNNQVGPMVLSVNCRFMAPLYYPGEVTIKTKAVKIGNTSLRLLHQLYDAQHKQVAEAEDVLVFYDFNQEEKISIPDEIKSAINSLEGWPL